MARRSRPFLPLATPNFFEPGDRARNDLRVLIVDDDPRVMDVVGEFLRHEGFETQPANSLAQAKDILDRDASFDLVLADYKLPDGCGVELLPGRDDDPASPVLVLMSSYRLQDIDDIGDLPLITKPLDLGELVAASPRRAEPPQAQRRPGQRPRNQRVLRPSQLSALAETSRQLRGLLP